MAIPVGWPSADEADDHAICVLLEALVQELVALRRGRLAPRRHVSSRVHPSRGATSETVAPAAAPAAPELPAPHPRLPLPDLMPDLPDCDIPRSPKPTRPTRAAPSDPTVWTETGVQLRHIADNFRSVHSQDSTDGKSQKMQSLSLLSVLCPALTQSIWTTLAFLLGWGFVTRNR